MKRKVLLPRAVVGAAVLGLHQAAPAPSQGEMALLAKGGTMKCFYAERFSSHESQASRGLQLPHEGQL